MTRSHIAAAGAALLAACLLAAPAGAATTHSWAGQDNALDGTGSANGVHTGSFTADGFIGHAFSYDGVSASTDFGDVGDTPTADFAIAFAVRTTQTDGAVALLTKRGACDSTQAFWDIHMGPTSVGYETYEAGGTNLGIGMDAAIADGFWHTITVTRTGSTMTGYIDGEQRASRTDATANVTTAVTMKAASSPCIGADGAVALKGDLDEIRIADAGDPDLLLPPQMVNTAVPVIAGAAATGSALTCSDGTWRYPVTRGLTRQWLRDGQPIDGATAATYTLTSADAAHTITCRVTAANQSGPASTVSAGLAVAAPAPAPAPSPAPSPSPGTPPAPSPTTVSISTLATLPPAKACVSRRRFPIRLRGVKAARIVRAQIRLDGRQVRNVTGRALGLPIDLRGLPKGRFTVEVVTTDSGGRRLVGRRTYRTCAPKRR